MIIGNFLFQVREQLGEMMQAQQEQNGLAEDQHIQVRVQRSKGTHNQLSEITGQWIQHVSPDLIP